MVRDVTIEWLEDAGYTCDVAHSDAFPGGVDWASVDPSSYSLVAFVCGPFGNGDPIPTFLARFEGIPMLGLNLSMLDALDEWNPFDKLLERDSTRTARPDMSFLHTGANVPVVGVILLPQRRKQPDPIQAEIGGAIDRVLATRELAVVKIDTCFDPQNTTGLQTPAEVESLIARMDAVITTRLHGLVLALKNGVPALAIDTVRGGGKIRRQAEALGWPFVLAAEETDEEGLRKGLDSCLADGVRELATQLARRAAEQLLESRAELREWLDERARTTRLRSDRKI